MLSWQVSTNSCQVIHEIIQRINFNNYCKKNCLHEVSLLYMILWWTSRGYKGVWRTFCNVKTIGINSYFPPIFCVKFLFSSYFFTLEIPIFLFFDPGSCLTPWPRSFGNRKQACLPVVVIGQRVTQLVP